MSTAVDVRTPSGHEEPRVSDLRVRVPRKASITILVAGLIMLAVFGFGADEGDTTFSFARGDAWYTIPNLPVPAAATSIVLGLVVIVLGGLTLWWAARGRRTPRWVVALAGVLFVTSFLAYVGAGRSTIIPVTTLLFGAVLLSVPIIFGAMAGVICERSGVINIAIEAQLLIGAFASAVMASVLANAYLGALAAPVAGGLVGALLAWFAVRYQVNQIIVGVVLNTLVIGLTGFFFSTVLTENPDLNTRMNLGAIRIPVLAEIPVVGPVLFNQSPLVYAMYVIVAVLHVMLFRSRWGLRTRAVGEHPKAADTVGVKVNPRRVWNVILGGAVAGLGGAYFTLGAGLAFGKEMSGGLGFIALAAMILGRWNPVGALLAALLFGFTRNLGNTLSTIGSPVPPELLLALPYLVTIVAVAGLIGRVRAPAADGVPYTK